MTKRKPKLEYHLSYCAGEGWIGDGSKASSPCPFKASKHIEAYRYICSHCASGIKPKDIYADSRGIHRDITVDLFPAKAEQSVPQETIKRRPGRPKGSKNKKK